MYHYAGNNPVKYIDPDGRVVFMVGVTVTGGMGTGLTMETGIILSIDEAGNYQLGLYQVSGAGFMASVGASIDFTFSIAPLAQQISDITGMTETIGGGTTIGLLPINIAGDINIPIGGSIKNFYISLHCGLSTKGPDFHGMTTTTTADIYAKGTSFSDVWDKAISEGMFKDLPNELIEHFKEAYMNYSVEE